MFFLVFFRYFYCLSLGISLAKGSVCHVRMRTCYFNKILYSIIAAPSRSLTLAHTLEFVLINDFFGGSGSVGYNCQCISNHSLNLNFCSNAMGILAHTQHCFQYDYDAYFVPVTHNFVNILRNAGTQTLQR